MRVGQKMGRDREVRWFHLVIQPVAGLSLRQERQFELDLANYLYERELIAEGASLHMLIRAEAREVGVTDQVDLIRWLVTETPVCSVRVGRLVSSRRTGQTAWITATQSDKALRPALDLYCLGRIDARTVIEILDGDSMMTSSHTTA